MADLPDAVVVGAGPSGQAGANLLAHAGWDVVVLEAEPDPGGAVHSDELTVSGFVHDRFSDFYPLGGPTGAQQPRPRTSRAALAKIPARPPGQKVLMTEPGSDIVAAGSMVQLRSQGAQESCGARRADQKGPAMSTDETVTKDLVETLEDGKEGFAKGAEKLESSGNKDVSAVFHRLSGQRAQFAAELRDLAQGYGDDVDESGSLAGKLHRGWMSLKDALAGSSDDGVLDAAEQGEDHAVGEYEKASKADISPTLRAVVERQFTEIKKAHDEVKSLRNAHS